MNKLYSILLSVAVCSLLQATNLVPNADFKVFDQQRPQHWTHFIGRAKTSPFQYENGVLTIREAASNYVSSSNVFIPLDGFKSYQWDVEMKLDNVKKMAAIFYYWTDADGNRITSERYLTKLKGSSDWQKISRTISPDDPAKTHGIRICLAIYHDPDSPGQVLYRNPSLQVADRNRNRTAAAPAEKKKPPTIPVSSAGSFAENINFIYRKSHEAYQKFAGIPGFLSMSSSVPSRESVILNVRVPEAATLELHLLHGGCAKFQKLFVPEKIEQYNQEKAYRYQLPTGIIWNFIGNALFFNENAPLKEYSIHLEFEFAEPARNFQREIQVQLRPRITSPAPTGDFQLYSWYSYPILRLDLDQGTMGKDLMKLWQDCGFRGGNGNLNIPDWSGYCDISNVFHYRHKDGISLPASQTPDGNPAPLACLSVLNDLDSGFLQGMQASERLTGLKTKRLVYDYEPYAGGAGWVTRACFCTRCRKDFAQQEGLPLLSAKEILTQHEKAWVRFRCRQRAEFIKNINALIKKTNPAAEFYLCSMPLPSPTDAERFYKEYGIDLKLCEPFVDGHMPMNYSPSLDFYYRQLQMALDLKKPLYPVLDNGWGANFHYQPERSRGQLLASAFMGIKGIYFGAGLMRMDAAWLEMCHQTLTAIDRFQPLLDDSSIEQKTWTMQKGLFADGNVFTMTRYQEKSGVWLLFSVNNSPKQTAFAQLRPNQDAEKLFSRNYAVREFFSERQLWPDKTRTAFSKSELFDKGLPLLVCRPVEEGFSAAEGSGLVTYASDLRSAESNLREQLENQYKPRSEFGMSSRMLPEGLELQTPSQTLLVHLDEGACATWSANKDGKLARIVNDWFVEPEVLVLTDNHAELSELKFSGDELQAEFRYQIQAPAFEGLIFRKRYILSRNRTAVNVQISIEPGSDYRPFRYRVANLLDMDRDQSGSSYPDKIEYRVQGMNGDEISRQGHAIFIHPEAALPEGKPFFDRYAVAQTFTGNWLEAQHTLSKKRLRAEFNGVDQLFLWRAGRNATMEWIYADPYPDRDPHKVKTWHAEFKLEFFTSP
jgi:hypothetical protein